MSDSGVGWQFPSTEELGLPGLGGGGMANKTEPSLHYGALLC